MKAHNERNNKTDKELPCSRAGDIAEERVTDSRVLDILIIEAESSDLIFYKALIKHVTEDKISNIADASLAEAPAAVQHKQYDIIFIKIKLPLEDYLLTARKIRKICRSKKRALIPIIGIITITDCKPSVLDILRQHGVIRALRASTLRPENFLAVFKEFNLV